MTSTNAEQIHQTQYGHFLQSGPALAPVKTKTIEQHFLFILSLENDGWEYAYFYFHFGPKYALKCYTLVIFVFEITRRCLKTIKSI